MLDYTAEELTGKSMYTLYVYHWIIHNFFIFRVSDMLDCTAEELTGKSMYTLYV